MVEQPEQQKITPIEFVKEKLKQNPEAAYSEIKAQAKLEGLTVYPVVYGRAKALLGLVPTAPYGSKSKARKKAKEAKALQEALRKAEGDEDKDREGNGRSRARHGRAARVDPSSDPLSSLETLVSDLKATVAERDRYRSVLEKVIGLLRAELDGD
ncbi:MAG: hypothetical protein ACYTGW_02305 [Planctomycetota bacterium]|jgi:hypothetical protein